MPFISVIIPVYNTEQYLAICIQSVLSQTFDDFEILLINDGSTDGSLHVIKIFAGNDDRIKVHSLPNGGQSVARNFALKKASGQYVMFLDSDDFILGDLFSEAVKRIKNQSLDMFIYSASSFDDSNSLIRTHDYHHQNESLNRVLTGKAFFYQAIENKSFHTSPCIYIVKRSLMTNIAFKPDIIHEDNLFTPQVLLSDNCRRIFVTNKTYYQRRVHQHSTTGGNKTIHHAKGLFSVYSMLVEWIRTPSLDKKSKHALKKWASINYLSYLHTLHKAEVAPEENRLTTFFANPRNLLDSRIVLSLISTKFYFALKAFFSKR